MLLSDTYRAFNLADEDAVYDRLARNLGKDLVSDVYLDSRRRLAAGTREGAEITVKDVSVVAIEDAFEHDRAEDAFAYPCTWVVTARIKHWQHIHTRQNIYSGVLTIHADGERWRVIGLDLLDEERVVVGGPPR